MILLKTKKYNIFPTKDKINFNIEKKITTLIEIIEEYERTNNFEYIECPCCHSDKLVFYGGYKRNIGINNNFLTIKIKRVKCKNCGKTHALIPSFIVPFFEYEASYINFVLLLYFKRKKQANKIMERIKLARQLL